MRHKLEFYSILTELKNHLYEEQRFFLQKLEIPTLKQKEEVKVEEKRPPRLIMQNKVPKVRIPEIHALDSPLDQISLFAKTKESELDKRIKNMPTKEALSVLEKMVTTCHKCSMNQQRKRIVFSYGSMNSPIFFVSDHPGQEICQTGLPLNSEAGKLFENMLLAINLRIEDVYMTSVVKCPPLKDREPEFEEIETCRAYLNKQIELINPKIVVPLGHIATSTLLGLKQGISRLRGRLFRKNNRLILPMFHPSALIKQPALKQRAWFDLKLLNTILESL